MKISYHLQGPGEAPVFGRPKRQKLRQWVPRHGWQEIACQTDENMNFLLKFLEGPKLCSDRGSHYIDDFITQWHTSDVHVSLHEFLGMTWTEYASWAENRKTPYEILSDRCTVSP